MEITNKLYGTPEYKTRIIKNWKYRGVIHDDFDALFEQYINTTHCNHCATPFKSTRDRCVDHDHTTGLFRMIVCHKCNACDSYIRYPNGYDEKEYNKLYRKNKEQVKERLKQKINCECGVVSNRGHIAQHKKSSKHISWRTNILRKYIEIWRYKSQR